MDATKHQTHPGIIKRLKGVEGHLRKTVAMLEAGRPCVDVAQQLQAIEKAVASAKKLLIHDHLEHCLGDGGHPGHGGEADALAEFREIAKYL